MYKVTYGENVFMLFSSGFLGENCLLWVVTNLILLYDGMTGWVNEGRIVDVVSTPARFLTLFPIITSWISSEIVGQMNGP